MTIYITNVEGILEIPGIDRETATKVHAVLTGALDPCEASPRTTRWVAQCWNTPAAHELALSACNELLEMHGVEAIGGNRSYTDEGMRFCPQYSYCNAGDPYVPTLMRDHARSMWIVAAWGDIVE